MIISDEDDQQIKDPPVVVPTVRRPEPAASRSLGPLPDYETSQALAFRDFNESQITLYKPPPRRRFLDSRFWRAVLVSLVVYIFLSLVVAVPIIVHVSFLLLQPSFADLASTAERIRESAEIPLQCIRFCIALVK